MLVASSQFNDLRYLRFRHFKCVNAADPDTVAVDVKHYLHSILMLLSKEPLQHMYDKLHRGVVIV